MDYYQAAYHPSVSVIRNPVLFVASNNSIGVVVVEVGQHPGSEVCDPRK